MIYIMFKMLHCCVKLLKNGFELMYKMYGFNHRKCNSASSLSGCIEKEISKIIIALSTNNTIMEVFEKTITAGFSCVNTRLALSKQVSK